MQTTEVKKGNFKIGDLMELFKLNRSTINHYINIGLIHVAHKNENSGYRIFGDDAVERLKRIEVLKERSPKTSLIEMKKILDEELPLI